MNLPAVCILAGGRGTRLGNLARDVPKPVIEVAGKPFLAHQLQLLHAFGARRVVLCVGHLGAEIERRIGAGPIGGPEIRYSYDSEDGSLVGTAGAVRRALPLLGERFLVMYGDTFLRIDYADVARAHVEAGKPVLMTVLRNESRWGRSNAILRDGLVVAYDKRSPTPEMRWIDYGLSVMRRDVVAELAPKAADLSDVFHELADAELIAGYEATHRFYEVGTSEALAETDRFLRRHVP